MSGRRYSGRHYRRRRSPVPAILLLIVAAALVLGALAIFTDVFKKDKPADRADGPAVIQPDDTQKPDDARQPSGGADGQDGQTGGDTQQPDNSGSQTGSKTLDTITTDATPYQSGGVYIVGDTGFEMYNYVDSLAKNSGEIVTSVAAQLSGTSTVYALAVPLSSGITLPDALYSDIPGSDQAQAEKNILAAMGENVKTVPLHDVMMSHRGEYIYFRTDHHWTQLGAYYAYTAFCEAAGFDAVPLEQFQTGRYDTFLGSMYTFTKGYPQSDVLKQHPDYLDYYLPIADTHARYYADGSLENGTPVSVVYTQLDESVSNKYLCFIGGDTPVCIVESDVQGPTCIVLKESYGNAFVPFLTSHYGRIIVIDPREFNQEGKPTLDLAAFAADQGVDDLIVINYPYMINSKAFVRYLNALAGVK